MTTLLITLLITLIIEILFRPRLDYTTQNKLLLWYGVAERDYIVLF